MEHLIIPIAIPLCLFVWMVRVVEFVDYESASVDVEVDVPFLEVGGDCFPDLDFRVHPLNFAPSGIAYSFTVAGR